MARLRRATATSAGGIVIRIAGGRPQLVVGVRQGVRDRATTTLPKGTPTDGESLEETALREVGEETGLEVRITRPVGAIEYSFVQSGTRIHKTVHYFLMEPVGGDLARHDHEFDQVRWIDLADAPTALTFETERDLVARAASLIAPDAATRAADAGAVPAHGARDGMMTEPNTIHDTPLRARHEALGARLIEFGGWLMPVQYTGILDEHRAVRERAGLFDLSHMGELYVEGPEAGAGLARAVISDPTALAVGRAQYSMLCEPSGGVIDDLIIYRLGQERFLVVANASNAGVVSDTLTERLAGLKAIVDDDSFATALVAIQGPRAVEILGPMTNVDLGALRYYGIARGEVAGIEALVARTGYTGEDGFELFVEARAGVVVWDALIEAGRPARLAPVGLGARDTLRLEAGMPLYGNELDTVTNPIEAGLGRVIRFEKEGDFVGRTALERVKRDGPAKKLVGLIVRGRGIARHGYAVRSAQGPSGTVTSGAPSPTLGVPIAMAYVAPRDAEPGTMLEVEIRGQGVPAEVVSLPFYKRPR